MSKDISRYLFQPSKHYSGVRMQQGRVTLDSDWNEGARLEAEEARQTRLDLIGPMGTADEGFFIDNVTGSVDASPSPYDFEIFNGTFTLGGLRLVVESDQGYQTYLQQNDWVHVGEDDYYDPRLPRFEDSNSPPQPPTPPSLADLANGPRYDLVFLRAWEQPVTAVEDGELIEAALGGPDTSVRMRRMWRVGVMPGLEDFGGDCAGAFLALIEAAIDPTIYGAPESESNIDHSFDLGTCELRSAARLKVSLDGPGTTPPCEPSVPGGFLGAENETFRVQLVTPDSFVWGRDNASPLYRVTPAAGERTKIFFQTQPRDQASQPLEGQAVEILPQSARLPNGEFVAEAQGHLATVTSSYNPDPDDEDTPYLIINEDVPSEWTEETLYLRLWTGGPAKVFTPETAEELGSTGLKVTFNTYGIPGDTWIVAARPETPDVVVPWELKDAENYDGAPPMGPRMFFAPLAIVEWRAEEGATDPEAFPHNCRRRFRPLGATEGCCTVTVGDGVTSHGQVNCIKDAISALPLSGGTICLLPGTFADSFEISGKDNITIRGCGPRSRVVNPSGTTGMTSSDEQEPTPLITICNSTSIRLESFAVSATGLIGIRVERTTSQTTTGTCSDISLQNLDLAAQGSSSDEVMPLTAIDVLDVDRLTIEGCRITTDDVFSPYPAVFLQGRELRLTRCRIVNQQDIAHFEGGLPFSYVPSTTSNPSALAWGGVQIGGDSQAVEVVDNVIRGGFGYGITLGSLVYREYPESTKEYTFPIGQSLITTPSGGGIRFTPFPADLCGDGEEPTLEPYCAGALSEISIKRNRIDRHGASGIASAAFFELDVPLSQEDPTGEEGNKYIKVLGLLIEENEIVDNFLGTPAEFGANYALDPVMGGIALSYAAKAVLRCNQIRNNGSNEQKPVVGVGVIAAKDVEIANNFIEDIGREYAGSVLPTAIRGGIAVRYGAPYSDDEESSLNVRTSTLRIHDNRVCQPEGKALWLGIGDPKYSQEDKIVGPVSVCANSLESWGDHAPLDMAVTDENDPPNNIELEVGYSKSVSSRKLYGACVEITNLSPARDVTASSAEKIGLYDGRVMFHDNQTFLKWTKLNGATSAVAIVSKDDVSVLGNQHLVNMGNSLVDGETPQDFLDKIASNDGSLADRSFLLFHLVAMGRTVRVSSNRITEGRSDVAGSILSVRLSIEDTTPPDGFGIFADGNQTTHCVFTDPKDAQDNQILIYHTLIPSPSCSYNMQSGSQGVHIVVPNQTA
jgi:hypothetical protein